MMQNLFYGGAFNPVGNHHFIVAQMAKEWGGYHRVGFIPCYDAPHKTDLLPYHHRRELLRIGGAYHGSYFDVLDIEKALFEQTGRKSYTIETVRALKRLYKSTEVHLLIGSDSLEQLHTWHEAEALVKETTLIVAPRHGEKDLFSTCTSATARAFIESNVKNIVRGDSPFMDVSSTLIRQRRAEGKSIRYLVPRGVEQYLDEHKLLPLLFDHSAQWTDKTRCKCNVCGRVSSEIGISDGHPCDAVQLDGRLCTGILL